MVVFTVALTDARERVEDRPFIIHCQYPRHVDLLKLSSELY